MRARNRSVTIRPMRSVSAWPVALLTMVCACRSCTQAPAPSATPTRYTITKTDLYAASSNDICRTRNAAFRNGLVQRVSTALPPGTSSFDFVDFQAIGSDDDKAASMKLPS